MLLLNSQPSVLVAIAVIDSGTKRERERESQANTIQPEYPHHVSNQPILSFLFPMMTSKSTV
jgi:hypothetical protein